MRILQLTNYPLVQPMHGGQIRAAQIAKFLRSAGNEVKSLAVYLRPDFAEADADDIAVDATAEHFRLDIPQLSDYFTGIAATEDERIRARAQDIVRQFAPELIIVEQPWLFTLAKQLAGTESRTAYSSQNIEWRLKSALISDAAGASTLLARIRELERTAATESDLVLACTDEDARELKQLSSSGDHDARKFIVCGNGVEPFTCASEEVARWQKYFLESIGSPYAAFVSSGHLPNAIGFWQLMHPGLTFLRPNEQIVVIGGVGELLPKVKEVEFFRDVNLSRLHLVGRRPKDELQAMVRASHVVILPISIGEGSNLKTAEALESGCHILGTSKSFRGFEEALELPHVMVADTPSNFRRALRQVLDRPRNTVSTPKNVLAKYHWASQLKPLLDAVSDVT